VKNISIASFSSEKMNKPILILILLLVIPFRILIFLFFPSEPLWASTFQRVALYSLMCYFVCINRGQLRNFHLGKVSIWILLLSGVLLGIGSHSIISLLFWIPSLILLVFYIKGRFHFQPANQPIGWFAISAIAGILVHSVIYVITALFMPSSFSNSIPWPGLIPIVAVLISQIASVVVFEEVIFRGLLWGYLESKAWDTVVILFFQAVLFWVPHVIYYSSFPITFWVVAPIMGLLLGVIAWRSHSVTACIIMHAIYNTISLFYLKA
jgi:membrane protease YdiL (CAAX protease family)